MPKLPVVSASEAIRVASRKGYFFSRQSGSHIVLKNSHGKIIVIPNHERLKPGTLLQIIKAL
jgi:predicted RNA binding protein YcfA (HicA-like mRNA interferase family)